MIVKVIKIPKFGENGDHVKSLQNALINRGFDPGPVDGNFGPKTKKAVASYQRSLGFAGSGSIGKETLKRLDLEVGNPETSSHYKDLDHITRDFIGALIVRNVQKDIDAKLRETHGKNRSPRIDEINTRAKTYLGAPYCAAGGWCAIDDACKELGLKNPVPPTARSQDFRRPEFVPAKYIRKEGSLGRIGDAGVLQTVTNSAQGHYVTVQEDQIQHPTFKTVEYNTDLSGDRDGDGAYPMERSTKNPSFLNSGKKFVCFTDIPQWILDHNRK